MAYKWVFLAHFYSAPKNVYNGLKKEKKEAVFLAVGLVDKPVLGTLISLLLLPLEFGTGSQVGDHTGHCTREKGV